MQATKKEHELHEESLLNNTKFVLDDWQKRVIFHDGNVTIRAGRQVGKSQTVSKRAARLAMKHPGTTSLIIAAAQRQSSLLFEKTMSELMIVHDALIAQAGGYTENLKLSIRQNQQRKREFEALHGLFDGIPTQTELRLKNGSRIYSLPAGKTGIFIRAFTIDFLYVDEAAFIPEPVWLAIIPMLAVPRSYGLGWETLLSTPFGKGGYFYHTFTDPDFLQIHVSSEQCPRISREFLRKEKNRLSQMEYSQEYLGEFTDSFSQFFPTQLIKECMTFITWNYKNDYDKSANYYLGSDIARYGADENAFVILEWKSWGDKWRIVRVETTERKSITETAKQHIYLDGLFHFRKIFTDDTGVGGGVTDILVDELGKHRVVGLDNARKSEEDSNRKGRILKEDLYSNALKMMESPLRRLELVADMKLLRSLKSMSFEYTSDRNLRIYGTYSHVSEAFVRACWAQKAKGLKLFIY